MSTAPAWVSLRPWTRALSSLRKPAALLLPLQQVQALGSLPTPRPSAFCKGRLGAVLLGSTEARGWLLQTCGAPQPTPPRQDTKLSHGGQPRV